jgi:hypothetical protein
MFFPWCGRPSFTTIQNNKQNRVSIPMFLDSNRKDETLRTGIPWQIMHADLFVSIFRKHLKLSTLLKEVLVICMLWFCPAVCLRCTHIYSVFSAFTLRTTFLVGTVKFLSFSLRYLCSRLVNNVYSIDKWIIPSIRTVCRQDLLFNVQHVSVLIIECLQAQDIYWRKHNTFL